MSAWMDGLDTNLREDLEALRRALREQRLVLVVGDALPGGDGGIRAAVEAEVRRIERTDLKEELEEKLARRLPMSVIADDLDAALLHDRLQRAAPALPDPTFAALAALGCPRVLTTRVDEGLPAALTDGRALVTPEKRNTAAGLLSRDSWLFLVRGRASEAERVALSRSALEERDADPTWKAALDQAASLPMLLVGVGLDEDAVLDRVLPRRRVQRGPDAPPDHWWLGCRPRPSARRRLGDVGARVIDLGDPKHLLPALTWLAEDPKHKHDLKRPPPNPGSASLLREEMKRRAEELPAFVRRGRPHLLPTQLFVEPTLGPAAEAHRPLPLAVGRSCSLPQALATGHERWLLEGEPGAGKSTLLREEARRRLEDLERLTLLLTVSEVARRGGLAAAVDATVADATSVFTGFASRGACTVLLDGFDEVGPSLGGSAGARRAVAQAAGALFAGDTEGNLLLVAGRPTGFLDTAFDAAWLPLRLRPLEPGAALELLRRHLDGNESEAAAIFAELCRARHDEVIGNPLLLSLAADIARGGRLRDLPLHRSGLLEEAARTLLCQRHREPHPSVERAALEAQLDRLSAVALRLHGAPGAGLLWDTVAAALSAEGDPQARETLRELVDTTGLLEEDPSDPTEVALRFPHRSLRELLAGRALAMRVRRSGVDGDAVQTVLAEAAGDPGGWSQVVVHSVAVLSGQTRAAALPGAADALVVAATRHQLEGKPSLAVLAVADAEGLSVDTLLAVLGVSAERVRWEERATVFERLPKLVEDAGKLVRVCDQYRRRLKPTHGADLFWLGWLLDRVAASDTAALELREVRPDDAAEARTVRGRLFEHLDPTRLARLRAALDPDRRWPAEGGVWCPIPPFEGVVGARPDEQYGRDYTDEKPQTAVRLEAAAGGDIAVLLARDPVQNELFELFDPEHERRLKWKTATDDLGRHPVVELSWWEATAFGWLVDHLLRDTDWGCRLPLELEWELAARDPRTTGGAVPRFWNGDRDEDLDRVGWTNRNSGGGTHAVEDEPPGAPVHPFGLRHLHGNVQEWCADEWDDRPWTERLASGQHVPAADAGGGAPSAWRVFRGGSWFVDPVSARAAYRSGRLPTVRYDYRGLRLALAPRPRS